MLILALTLSAAVSTQGASPFSAAQLERALTVRGAPSVEVDVEPVGLDAVAVRHAGRRRVVPLHGRRGAGAARWVALAVVEWLEPPLALDVGALAPPRAVVVRPEAPPPPPEAARLWLAAIATSRAGPDLRPWFGGAVEVAARPWRSGVTYLSAGVAGPPRAQAGVAAVSVWSLPIRLGAGWRLWSGQVELRAGARLMPMRVTGDDGADLYRRWLTDVAFGGSAIARVPIEGRWALRGVLGVDAALRPRDLQVDGVSVLTTERVSAWLALGVEWEAWR